MNTCDHPRIQHNTTHNNQIKYLLSRRISQACDSQTEKMFCDIFNSIPSYSLKKGYFPNNADGTNDAIKDIAKLSPADIEKRIKSGKGIFYMNPCISQTLYTINKLKEEYPNLEEYITLGIEFFEFENGIKSAHTFIEIKIPNGEKIIIDYARNNDVYIYQGDYYNNSKGIKSNSSRLISIESNKFNKSDNKSDNIFKIAKKAGFDKESISKLENDLNILQNHLCNENKGGDKKYKSWEDTHGTLPVCCLKNGKDKDGNIIRTKLKIESTEPLKIFIADGEDEKGNIIWRELVVEEKSYPPKIFKKTENGLIEVKFKNDSIPFLISYCK